MAISWAPLGHIYFWPRDYGTGTNILIGRMGKLSHFWFLESVSADDWQDLCLVKVSVKRKCKKFHVNCMLLSERIGVRVSWQSCDACHVILSIKSFCHFQVSLSSAASSGGLQSCSFPWFWLFFRSSAFLRLFWGKIYVINTIFAGRKVVFSLFLFGTQFRQHARREIFFAQWIHRLMLL